MSVQLCEMLHFQWQCVVDGVVGDVGVRVEQSLELSGEVGLFSGGDDGGIKFGAR